MEFTDFVNFRVTLTAIVFGNFAENTRIVITSPIIPNIQA